MMRKPTIIAVDLKCGKRPGPDLVKVNEILNWCKDNDIEIDFLEFWQKDELIPMADFAVYDEQQKTLFSLKYA